MPNHRKSSHLTAIPLFIVLLTQGCATIVNHRTVDVPITTHPAGAKITFDGQQYVSPAIIPIARKHGNQSAQIALEGYQTQEVRFKRSLSGWFFGNFVFINAFWIGMAVDLINGSTYNVAPERVSINLVPNDNAIKSAALTSKPNEPEMKTYELALRVRFTNESWFPLSKQEMTDAVKDKLLERLSESGRFRFNDSSPANSNERGYLNVDISLIESIETVKLTTTLQIPNGATFIVSEDDTINNKDRKAIFETFRNVGKKVAENLTKKMNGKI